MGRCRISERIKLEAILLPRAKSRYDPNQKKLGWADWQNITSYKISAYELGVPTSIRGARRIC